MDGSEYKRVPSQLTDDEVIPSVAQISSSLVTSMRRPRRRAVSVGPQSEADAYEALAFREMHRRTVSAEERKRRDVGDLQMTTYQDGSMNKTDSAFPAYQEFSKDSLEHLPTAPSLNGPVAQAEEVIGMNPRREGGATEVVSQPERPRVRYDVEVVTKLIIYAGQ